MRFRGFLYSLFMDSVGKDFQVHSSVLIVNLSGISIGNNVYIGPNTVIISDNMYIGNEVLIGPNCVLVSQNHTKINQSFRFGPSDKGCIVIEENCWISSHCTISKDSKLPKGSVLGANSFLNKKFEVANAFYCGVPAVYKSKYE